MKSDILFILASVTLLSAGCGKPEHAVRAYREITMMDEQAAAPMQTPVASGGSAPMGNLPPEMRAPALPLTWTDPEGWSVVAGSGMRIATWTVEGQECTLMSFPGDVGGDEANIRRWLGQIGLSVDNETLGAFVANPSRFSTTSGLEVRLFDFSTLPGTGGKSVLAAIISVEDQSAFLKLMGDTTILQKQKPAFETLCRSIALK